MVVEDNRKLSTGNSNAPSFQGPRQRLFFSASQEDKGSRIDSFLAWHLSRYPRSYFQKLIRKGLVRVNQKRVKPSHRVLPGDNITAFLPPSPPPDLTPEDLSLEVLYEDDWFAALFKPAGLVVHPGPGNQRRTLVHGLLHRFKNLSGVAGKSRPGIVHRLDRDTSGLILIAKNDEAHHNLALQFKERRVEKEYRAIVEGEIPFDSDHISAPIARCRRNPERWTVDYGSGKEACTYYEVLERFSKFSYLKVIPHTGRTHQIRVHLASIHCPVTGDPLYGKKRGLYLSDVVDDPSLKPTPETMIFHRHALHAYRLTIVHPSTNARMEFVAPVPADMMNLLAILYCLKAEQPVREEWDRL